MVETKIDIAEKILEYLAKNSTKTQKDICATLNLEETDVYDAYIIIKKINDSCKELAY